MTHFSPLSPLFHLSISLCFFVQFNITKRLLLSTQKHYSIINLLITASGSLTACSIDLTEILVQARSRCHLNVNHTDVTEQQGPMERVPCAVRVVCCAFGGPQERRLQFSDLCSSHFYCFNLCLRWRAPGSRLASVICHHANTSCFVAAQHASPPTARVFIEGRGAGGWGRACQPIQE